MGECPCAFLTYKAKELLAKPCRRSFYVCLDPYNMIAVLFDAIASSIGSRNRCWDPIHD